MIETTIPVKLSQPQRHIGRWLAGVACATAFVGVVYSARPIARTDESLEPARFPVMAALAAAGPILEIAGPILNSFSARGQSQGPVYMHQVSGMQGGMQGPPPPMYGGMQGPPQPMYDPYGMRSGGTEADDMLEGLKTSGNDEKGGAFKVVHDILFPMVPDKYVKKLVKAIDIDNPSTVLKIVKQQIEKVSKKLKSFPSDQLAKAKWVQELLEGIHMKCNKKSDLSKKEKNKKVKCVVDFMVAAVSKIGVKGELVTAK